LVGAISRRQTSWAVLKSLAEPGHAQSVCALLDSRVQVVITSVRYVVHLEGRGSVFAPIETAPFRSGRQAAQILTPRPEGSELNREVGEERLAGPAKRADPGPERLRALEIVSGAPARSEEKSRERDRPHW